MQRLCKAKWVTFSTFYTWNETNVKVSNHISIKGTNQQQSIPVGHIVLYGKSQLCKVLNLHPRNHIIKHHTYKQQSACNVKIINLLRD